MRWKLPENTEMKTLKQKAPALWAIFFKSAPLIEIERPYGCYDCPFAKEHNEWTSRPNPADPGEGYYDCGLLNEQKIWGESPQCSADDWRSRGATEIEMISGYPIQQEILEEKATILLDKFSRALQDDTNGELTVSQLREKLLTGVEPRVIAAFNAKLRPRGGSI